MANCCQCLPSNAVLPLDVMGEDADELLGHATCEKLAVRYDFETHTLSK